MHDELERILGRYTRARTTPEKFGTSHELWRTFEAARTSLSESPPVQRLRLRRAIEVRWGAGQGNWAKVPWIALLGGNVSMQRGVYVVYLFRQDMSGVYLTLNQGVTEPTRRLGSRLGRDEVRQTAVAIRQHCTGLAEAGFSLEDDIELRADPGLGANYESSTIAHKLYQAGTVPDDSVLFDDLEAVLGAYDEYLESPQKYLNPQQIAVNDRHNPPSNEDSPSDAPTVDGVAKSFHEQATSEEVGLRMSQNTALRFVTSLMSKRFVILTGLAGSGKTQIAQAFARWITESNSGGPESQYLLLPVGADWVGNENILGYPDGLNPESYLSTPALQLLLSAARNESKPHFLILDEMNLSHVERYFADILSAIESGEDIPLYNAAVADGERNLRGDMPESISLPRNLFIVGTVNVDETTYMFSPKVLDRANTLEFRAEPSEIGAFLSQPNSPNLHNLDGKGVDFGERFVEASADLNVGAPSTVSQLFQAEMLLFFNVLREHNAEFGYRVAHESARFLHFYNSLGGFADGDTSWFNSAFDAIVVQKLLPKLHGSRSKLEGLLWALAWACGAPRGDRDGMSFAEQLAKAGAALDEASYSPDVVEKQLLAIHPINPAEGATYPLSYDKIIRMWRRLVRDQFVSFPEA